MDENHSISFQIFHEDEQLFEFQPSLILFFELHGTTQILCGSEEWQLEPAGLLSLNPFELFQVRCTENATALALHIPQELLRLAGWEDGAQCRCYAYGRQISSASLDEVHYLYAAIFQHFFKTVSRMHFELPVLQSNWLSCCWHGFRFQNRRQTNVSSLCSVWSGSLTQSTRTGMRNFHWLKLRSRNSFQLVIYHGSLKTTYIQLLRSML